MSQILNLALLLLIAFVTQNYGQILMPCHTAIFQFTPRHSLNISAYMGDWYMHEIGSSDIGNFPQPDYKCSKRTLFLPNATDLSNIAVVDTYVNITTLTSFSEEQSASVNATRSPLSSMWRMTSSENLSTNVIILWADLEFQQWTVVYSCNHRGPLNYRYEVLTAMTRSRTIDPELRQQMKALMVGQGFRIGDHYPIDQESCPP